MKNIVLIGMPGAGKSTVGVILAKTLCMSFIDTDILIQERQGKPLQQIIDSEGTAAFVSMEESCMLSLDSRAAVIASGGSAVYSDKAMNHLKSNGIAVYLKVGLDEIRRRMGNISTRGIVLGKGKSLSDIFTQRCPLYEKYADIVIDCTEMGVEDIVGAVKRLIPNTDETTGRGGYNDLGP